MRKELREYIEDAEVETNVDFSRSSGKCDGWEFGFDAFGWDTVHAYFNADGVTYCREELAAAAREYDLLLLQENVRAYLNSGMYEELDPDKVTANMISDIASNAYASINDYRDADETEGECIIDAIEDFAADHPELAPADVDMETD